MAKNIFKNGGAWTGPANVMLKKTTKTNVVI